MKLEKWALIAEIVSGVAIVVTLVILIVEVRGNTDAIQAQTINVHADAERRRREWLFLNEGGIADLILKGRDTQQVLSESERWRLERYYVEVLDKAEWEFGEVLAGRLPEAMLSLRTWRGMWRVQPLFSAVYEQDAAFSDRSPAFVEFWEKNVIRPRSPE